VDLKILLLAIQSKMLMFDLRGINWIGLFFQEEEDLRWFSLVFDVNGVMLVLWNMKQDCIKFDNMMFILQFF